jgi:hypothetical protein
VADQPLLLQLGERPEGLGERARLRPVETAEPQVDHVERVEPEAAQVAVHLLAQLLGAAGRRPAALLVAAGADLGDEVQVVRVRRERLADDLVGDVRAVVVGGVDVVDAQLDGRAQDGDRGVAVLWRPEHVGAGELHGAVPDAVEVEVADAVGAAGQVVDCHADMIPPIDATARAPPVLGAAGPGSTVPSA